MLRLPHNIAEEYRIKCDRHPKHRLAFFCETCKEPICTICRTDGHYGSGHPCIPLLQAYSFQKQHLTQLTETKLLPKREELLTQMQLLKENEAKISAARTKIEMEIRKHYQHMIQRLTDQESSRISILQTDIQNIQKELSMIDQHESSIKKYSDNTKHMIEFLKNSKDLEHFIEINANKEVKKTISVDANFVNELNSQQQIIDNYSNHTSKLQAAEEKIRIYEKRMEKLENQKESIEIAAKAEINEWIKLTNKFAAALSERNETSIVDAHAKNQWMRCEN